MLKEVGASGQISLGKKYAGQLFDLVPHPDGRLELVPMKAVPAVQEEASAYRIGDGWLSPERLARRKAAAERSASELDAARQQWEAQNRDAIEAMNQRMAQVGSMGTRIHAWRQAKA
ncbi:MAG: type II toxin-antitoxin system CcdA family antitoxin [Burkholderiales bacterium]|nr:type II toxin-antitoxin system CcdA family antitoxin [Burkholderiales bacterium]